MENTRLSSKGQIELPKTPADHFSEADLEDVAGSLRSNLKPKTIAQMHAGIQREIIRGHDRGRY